MLNQTSARLLTIEKKLEMSDPTQNQSVLLPRIQSSENFEESSVNQLLIKQPYTPRQLPTMRLGAASMASMGGSIVEENEIQNTENDERS